MKRWADAFEELLNNDSGDDGSSDSDDSNLQLEKRTRVLDDQITKAEVEKAIQGIHNGKAGGIDQIPAEVLWNNNMIY